MKTKISTKGQVALPQTIRGKINLRAGDHLEARIEGERIVLIPKKMRSRKGRIIKDPLTGLPVLTAGPGAPRLTSKHTRHVYYPQKDLTVCPKQTVSNEEDES